MFAQFVCALFGFCAHESSAKPENNLGHFFLTKGYMYAFIRSNMLKQYSCSFIHNFIPNV